MKILSQNCIKVHWKTPEKSRPSNFIFQNHTSGQSGQTPRLTAVPHLVNPLYHGKKGSATSFGDWAGHLLIKTYFASQVSPLLKGQLDLNDRNLSKFWMKPVNWNALTWEKIGIPMLSVYLESGWPGNNVDTLLLCQFQTHLSLDTWIPWLLRSSTIFMQNMIQQDSLPTC